MTISHDTFRYRLFYNIDIIVFYFYIYLFNYVSSDLCRSTYHHLNPQKINCNSIFITKLKVFPIVHL